MKKQQGLRRDQSGVGRAQLMDSGQVRDVGGKDKGDTLRWGAVTAMS